MKRWHQLGAAMAAIGAALVMQVPAHAQFAPISPTTAVPEPGAIPLPAARVASKSTEVWNLFGDGNPVVRNVTQPMLTPVLPDPANATGAAVIVAPGGGFFMLSMETEGFAVARRLAAEGIAAFVLKYRLQPTPVPDSEFLRAISERFRQAPRDPAGAPKLDASDAAADALDAIRLIRRRATQWRIDPKRVGIIGYSAGAMTAMTLAQTAPAGEGPAFIGYIYGPQAIDTIPAEAPPLFNALAIDDPLFHATSFPIVAAWHKAKRPVELHLYGSGGHGFGVGKANEVGRTHNAHLDQFVAWLRMQGFLPATASR